MSLVSMFHTRTLRLAAACIMASQLACAAHRAGQTDTRALVPLVFANESTTQADVWVVAPDVNTRRVGAVMAGETATLNVPREFYTKGNITFYARLRGSSTFPGIFNLPIRPDEPLRIRLPRDAKTLAVVR